MEKEQILNKLLELAKKKSWNANDWQYPDEWKVIDMEELEKIINDLKNDNNS